MKYFLQDLMYMCSSSNTTSRGFYLAMTIGSLLAVSAAVVFFIMAVLGKVTGAAATVSYIALPVILGLVIALMVWLAKQN